VQATAERGTYSRAEMDRLLDLAMLGSSRILAAQRAALERS
jgi:ribonuclease PH